MRHKRHDFSPCWDYRRIGMKDNERSDREVVEEDYNDYVKYLDDTLPPVKEENNGQVDTN